MLTLNKKKKYIYIFFKCNNGKPTATENITAIQEARKFFNDVRTNLSNNEKKVIKRKLYKKKQPVIFSKQERMMAL